VAALIILVVLYTSFGDSGKLEGEDLIPSLIIRVSYFIGFATPFLAYFITSFRLLKKLEVTTQDMLPDSNID